MSANVRRFDPYKSFRFRICFGKRTVAGMSKASGLDPGGKAAKQAQTGGSSGASKSSGRTKYEPITLKRGVTHDASFADWATHSGDSSAGGKTPGRTKYEAITLERGVTHDPAFEDWARSGRKRREMRIEVLTEAGRDVSSFKVRNCWVSEFLASPDLDANANAVAIEHIKLEHESWERECVGFKRDH